MIISSAVNITHTCHCWPLQFACPMFRCTWMSSITLGLRSVAFLSKRFTCINSAATVMRTLFTCSDVFVSFRSNSSSWFCTLPSLMRPWTTSLWRQHDFFVLCQNDRHTHLSSMATTSCNTRVPEALCVFRVDPIGRVGSLAESVYKVLSSCSYYCFL